MTDALPSGISIYETLNTLVGTYKVKPYAKTAPDKLKRYVRTHIPGWEVAGIRTFHHCPAVWFRNIETGQLVMAMAGTTPLKWKNLLKPALWHNWGRNITNEYQGLLRALAPKTTLACLKERTEFGRFKEFVEKAVKDFGPWDLTAAHSKAGFEVSSMDLDGSVLLVNPHPPHGKEGFNERTFVVRNSDDTLTTLIPRHRDQMEQIDYGGHGVQGAKEGFRGIWKDDKWKDVFPNKVKNNTPQGDKTSPKSFPRNEYPEPKHRTKADLYKAHHKQITHELYLQFKNTALEEIRLKTKDPHKISKKLKRVFDKGRPVDKSVRERIEDEAYHSVPQNDEYQLQLGLHNKKAEIDRQISLGNLKLVDQVRSTTGQSNQRLPKSLKDRGLVKKLPARHKDRPLVEKLPARRKDRVPPIDPPQPKQGKPSIGIGPKLRTYASFIESLLPEVVSLTSTIYKAVSASGQRESQARVVRRMAKSRGNNPTGVFGSTPLKFDQQQNTSSNKIETDFKEQLRQAKQKQRSCCNECVVL